MKVVTEDALRRANNYYDLGDEKLLTVRANEFVQKQKFLTAFLLAICRETGADAAAALMDAAIIWKTFLESGFDVPELSEEFLDHWDKYHTEKLLKLSQEKMDESKEEMESPLSCLVWQPLLVEYFLVHYFGDDFDLKAMKQEEVDPAAAQLNMCALSVVEIFHTFVNRESRSDS